MKEHDDEIEDLFRDRFSNDEAPISPRVWKNIKQTLPEEEKYAGFWRIRNIFFLGILLVASIGGVWFLWRESNHTNKTMAVVDTKNNASSGVGNTKRKHDVIKNGHPDSSINIGGSKNVEIETNSKNISKIKSDNSTRKESTSSSKTSYHNSSAKANEMKPSVIVTNDHGKNRNQGIQNKLVKEKGFNKTCRSDTDMDMEDRNRKNILDDETKKRLNKNNLVTTENHTVDNKYINDQKNTFKKEVISKTNPDPKEVSVSPEISNTKTEFSSTEMHKNGKDSSFKDHKNVEASHTIEDSQQAWMRENGKDLGVKDKNKTDPSSKSIKDTISNKDIRPISEVLVKKEQDSIVEKPIQDLSSLAASNKSSTQNHLKDSTRRDTITNVQHPEASSKSIDSIAISSDSTSDSSRVVVKKEDKKVPSRWSVDLLAGPAYTGAHTRATNESYQSIVSNKNKQDKNLINAAIGGYVNYQVSSRVSFSVGILYSGYSEKYNFKNSKSRDSLVITQSLVKDTIYKIDTIGQKVIDTIMNVQVTDTAKYRLTNSYSAKKTDHYSFLSLPVSVSYYVLKREKFSVLATTGVKINFLLKSTTYLANASMTDLMLFQSKVSHVSLSYLVSFAAEYKLYKHIYLIGQPSFSYQANSLYSKSSGISQKPYSMGLNLGIRIKL